MDYSIGSLADLISGTNTPNKPKVIKKAFTKDNGANTEEGTDITGENKKQIKNGKIKKTMRKPIKREITDQSNKLNAENVKQKKFKKRSIENITESQDLDEEESPPKKKKISTNEEHAERRIKNKIKEEKRVQNPEILARTVFVGNVPITCNKKKIKKQFKKYGEIESIRIRGIPVADLKTSKRVAAIKKEFNPNRSNVFCFIRFVDEESVLKAETENGSLFEGHHLRVNSCISKDKPDESRAIFVGNLSFNAVEDELWKLFEPCGPISHVRIVRDSHTGMGKGFGYVNFKDSDAVQLALEMENIKLNDREIRISLCNMNSARKNKKNKKIKKITQPGKGKPRNNFKKQDKERSVEESQNKVKHISTEFQGTKFSEKKKWKVNKGLLEKKKLIKKIAPKLK